MLATPIRLRNDARIAQALLQEMNLCNKVGTIHRQANAPQAAKPKTENLGGGSLEVIGEGSLGVALEQRLAKGSCNVVSTPRIDAADLRFRGPCSDAFQMGTSADCSGEFLASSPLTILSPSTASTALRELRLSALIAIWTGLPDPASRRRCFLLPYVD